MRDPWVGCALSMVMAACAAQSDGNNGGVGSGGAAGDSGGTNGSAAGATGVGGAAAGTLPENPGASAGSAGSAGEGGRAGGGDGGESGPGTAGRADGGRVDAGRAGGPEAGGPTGERPDSAVPGGSGEFGYDGPSRCDTAGVAFCDGFENGLNATTWTTTKSGDATIVVEPGRAARGTSALHVKTATGSGHAYITERMAFPATNNTLYGRMFVYFVDPLTTGGHFSLAEGGGTGNSAVIRFGGQNNFFGVGTDGGASGDWTDKDNKVVGAGAWICTEFQMKGDTNEFHVWKDDVELTTLRTGVAKHPGFAMPTFNHLWFGWWMYNATEPQELWIDEVAVDYKPIGCAK